jgi:hypothetical protein
MKRVLMSNAGSGSPLSESANWSNPRPTAKEIAARAYELFIADGRRVSRVNEYWLQAEEELRLRSVDERRGG